VAADIKVLGLPQFKAALAAKAAAMRVAAAFSVATEVKSIENDATGAAPRDTGELASEISSRTTGTRGEVESASRHAGFQEFGTSSTPAQPYMTPAAQRSRGRFVGRTTGAIRKAVS
jgi:HK97 gp10 family phage protein